MRASTAYFVGAGTIVAAIAIGLGGGIVAGNIMNPVSPKQGPDTSKIAQRADAKPATTNAPSESLQYLTGSQAFGAMVAAPAQAETKPEAKSEAVKPDTQATQANAEQTVQQPSQAAAVEPPKPAPASPPQVAKPAERQASTEPSSTPDNAYAKARDSDVKRATSERRRTERRERWAERRHYDSREPHGMRDRTDWDDVARNIREDSDARDVASRPRSGFPQIRLFGDDD
ncbi:MULTISPECIES: hypothetical protein [unclassified Bradyrhizobium]|jgi:hypothetical protein|uniref:hypothetical protein n=1 Tax=unclassified Bradyrhizobium TaxID=2631580 RepID=UPI0023AE7903|nr:hypothetical protein [Bradyrhizobium sp. CSS354]MDE5462729.1 hypothetical protein [Bradyrhizobium sp. CSS354]